MQIIILVKISVVKWISTRYNILNLRCTITLTSFEPTFTLNGIPILPSGCQALTPQGGLEGRQKVGCGYPPSIARSQKVRGGILGITIQKRAVLWDCSFKVIKQILNRREMI